MSGTSGTNVTHGQNGYRDGRPGPSTHRAKFITEYSALSLHHTFVQDTTVAMAATSTLSGSIWMDEDGNFGLKYTHEDLYELARDNFYGALKDPLLERKCIYTLLGYFGIVCSNELAEDPKCSDKRLLDTCADFLTRPRPFAQLCDMDEATRCRCDLSAPPTLGDIIAKGLHSNVERTYKEAFPTINLYALAGIFASTIVDALVASSSHLPTFRTKRRVQKRTKNGTRPKPIWPSESSQLFPHGPEDSVRALAQWAATTKMTRTIGLICHFVDYLVLTCRQVIIPYVVTSPLLADSFLNGIYWGWSSDSSEQTSVRQYQASIFLLHTFSGLLHNIGTYANGIQIRRFVDGDGADLAVHFARDLQLLITWITQAGDVDTYIADTDK